MGGTGVLSAGALLESCNLGALKHVSSSRKGFNKCRSDILRAIMTLSWAAVASASYPSISLANFRLVGVQLGAALAVILITYFKLSHISSFSVNAGNRTYESTGTCLLNADTSKTDMCIYAYTISGVSIIATFIVALFLVSLLHFSYRTSIYWHAAFLGLRPGYSKHAVKCSVILCHL